MKIRNVIGSLLLCAAMAGCGSNNTAAPSGGAGPSGGGQSISLTGAGSTFVNPAMSKWIYAYQQANPGITINYQPVGSGAGIGQLKAGTVDFAASDVAMGDKDMGDLPGPVVQMPVVSGCVVIAYNLPGVDKGLNLAPDVIADIYLGKIKTWNDPRIAKDNAGKNLPATPITVAHRSDGSGTSYIFTDYLSTVSADWKAGPGKGKTVNWPAGVGGKGNDGVAGLVKQTPGGIGYVELAYAIKTNMAYANVKNKSGKWIEPSVDSTAAAVNAAADALKADIRSSIVDTAAGDGYPIAGFTYVIVYKEPKDPAKAKAVMDFLKWALKDGQPMAKDLQYAPLPQAVTDVDTGLIGEVKTQ